MAESDQDRVADANEASKPVSTRPEMIKRPTGAKATKWSNAPDVVGEESGKTGQEEEPKGDAPHGTEDEPQTQDVTDTAGTVNDAGQQDGDAAQVPARAENDPLVGTMEPASNFTDPSALTPEGETLPANERSLDAPMYRDDRDHPHFANSKVQGTDDTSSSDSDDAPQRSKDLDAREAELDRREQAMHAPPSTITDRDIDDQIIGESYADGGTAFGSDANLDDDAKQALGGVTLCALRLRHGGFEIGTAQGGPLDGAGTDLRAQAKADARAKVESGLRYAHRMKVAGL